MGNAVERPAKILLVDDEPANLLALEAVLGTIGQLLIKASSGEEALRRLLEEDFAVILLDVKMGTLDGFETAKLIRGRARSQHTPIIFLTAHDDNRLSVEEAYALGVVDYLVKPVPPVVLRAKVAAFADLFRQAERLAAAEAVRLSEARLREESQRKDEYLAMLAHELRNPIAPLRNGLEVLRHTVDDDPDAAESMGIMERQLRHLTRLVDDLLDVSRITRGRLELRREVVDLADVVRDAADAASPILREARHELEICLPTEPVQLDADPARLSQVITNLLTNAAKYTPAGGRVWLEASSEGDHAIVRVRDTGVGLAPDMLPRVFDLFAQADRSLARSQGGLGIGLTLVKNLVERHGGRVEAHSSGPGRGSEFVVRLPLRPQPGSSPEIVLPTGD